MSLTPEQAQEVRTILAAHGWQSPDGTRAEALTDEEVEAELERIRAALTRFAEVMAEAVKAKQPAFLDAAAAMRRFTEAWRNGRGQ